MPDYINLLSSLYCNHNLKYLRFCNNTYCFHYENDEWYSYISLADGIQKEYARQYAKEYRYIFTEAQLQEIENGKMSGKELAELIRRNNANSK